MLVVARICWFSFVFLHFKPRNLRQNKLIPSTFSLKAFLFGSFIHSNNSFVANSCKIFTITRKLGSHRLYGWLRSIVQSYLIYMLCPICYFVRFAGSTLEKCFRKEGMKNFHGVNQRRAKIPKILKRKKNFSFFKGRLPFDRFSWIANRTQHIPI